MVVTRLYHKMCYTAENTKKKNRFVLYDSHAVNRDKLEWFKTVIYL